MQVPKRVLECLKLDMDSVVGAHAVDQSLQPEPRAHRGLDCSLQKHIIFAAV